jgi:hypothetical protein
MGDLNFGFSRGVIGPETDALQRRPDQTGVVNLVFDQQNTERARRRHKRCPDRCLWIVLVLIIIGATYKLTQANIVRKLWIDLDQALTNAGIQPLA